MQYKEDSNYLLLDFSRYLADNHVVVIGMTDGSLVEHFKVYLREKDYKAPRDMERFIWLFKFFFMTPDPEKENTHGLHRQHHEAQALPGGIRHR